MYLCVINCILIKLISKFAKIYQDNVKTIIYKYMVGLFRKIGLKRAFFFKLVDTKEHLGLEFTMYI